jgi:hypothetical protein
MYAVAYWPVRWELAARHSTIALSELVAAGLVAIIVLELIGRRAALQWKIEPDVEFGDASEAPTLLNLGQVDPKPLTSS